MSDDTAWLHQDDLPEDPPIHALAEELREDGWYYLVLCTCPFSFLGVSGASVSRSRDPACLVHGMEVTG